MAIFWVWTTLIIAAAAAALYALVAWICIVTVTLWPVRRGPHTYPPRYRNGVVNRPTQAVRLTCADGTRLEACFVPAISRPGGPAGDSPEAAPWPKGALVLLHGISDAKERLLPLAGELSDQGFDVLLPDLRGHGQSGGRICTYGYRERQDVRAAVDWLAARGAETVGLLGVSLGGAVALLTAAEDPRVAAVVSEGAYASLRQIIGDYAARHGALRVVHPPAIRLIEKIAHMKLEACDPLAAAERLAIPVLLIHGREDTHVQPGYASELASHMGERCELWLVDRAPHSRCRETAGAEYAARVGAFFSRSLGMVTAEQEPAPAAVGAGSSAGSSG